MNIIVASATPETQVMLERFNGDLAALLMSCAKGNIDTKHLSFVDDVAICVVMAAKGYPAEYEKGTIIRGCGRGSAKPKASTSSMQARPKKMVK